MDGISTGVVCFVCQLDTYYAVIQVHGYIMSVGTLMDDVCWRMQEAVPEDAMKEELMDSLSKGNFTMRILYEQLANIQKMGPVGQVMGMIPGLSNSGLFTKVCPTPHHTCCLPCTLIRAEGQYSSVAMRQKHETDADTLNQMYRRGPDTMQCTKRHPPSHRSVPCQWD